MRKAISVKAAPERAFRVFTAEMTRWWHPDHHIGKSPLKAAVVEPRAGGRWYEVGEDGSECEWGKVLVWDPPARVVFAWQLTGEWKYDSAFVTEVEVRFIPEGLGHAGRARAPQSRALWRKGRGGPRQSQLA